ncbi:MAG: Aspartyl protease [Mucilaginibacter sp.]|nr:Aspartyl protease [Mucilaginibacter sp.]
MKIYTNSRFFYLLLRCTIYCLFLLLSTAVCTAQRVTFNKGGTESTNYYEEIPYEYINGVMFLTSEINGIKRKFVFDTGAPVQITPELFDELKPEIINHTEISDATGKKTTLNIVSLAALKLNNLSFTGIPALVSSSSLYKCWHIDGIIGSNILRKSIVQILPAKHLIILTDDETKLSLNKKMQLPLITGEPQSYPFFNIQLANKKTQTVGFDTGSPTFLRMTEADASRFKNDDIIEKISTGYGINHMSLLGLQIPDSLYRLKISSLIIAGCTFTNVVTETNKSRNTRIGTKILDYGKVTIDFIHHYFYFEPAVGVVDLSEKLWPLKTVVADDKLVVGVVWGKLKDQIKSGDQIMTINDEPCQAISLCDWLNGKVEDMLNKPTATLTLKDKYDHIKKISMTKE